MTVEFGGVRGSNEASEHVLAVVREQRRPLAHPTREQTLTEQLEAIIEKHHRDPELGVDGIARALHFSRRQLYRSTDGDGIAAMLAERRVRTACELLHARPDLSINDVALLSGFTSASRLRMHLVRRFGVTPTEYRERAQLTVVV